MASYLLDTNVVMRLIDRHDSKHSVCVSAIERLIAQQQVICLAPQVLVEFWVVATRPNSLQSNERRGLGWSPKQTDQHIGELCRLFRLDEETPALFGHWRQLVSAADTRGKRAHDARIVAFMQLCRIDAIVTLNPRDFQGFGVQIVKPEQLTASTS